MYDCPDKDIKFAKVVMCVKLLQWMPWYFFPEADINDDKDM